MKKIYTLAIGLSFTLILRAQNPVPNPGFEAWDSPSGPPTDWANSEFMTRSTDKHSGTYAARGDRNTGGAANLELSNFNGFSTTTRWAYLNFFYKLPAGGSFTASISLDSSSNIIGQAFQTITTAAATYKSFSMPITYLSGGNPLLCKINIAMPPSAPVGAYYIIDDMSVSQNPLSIDDMEAETAFNIMPNPAANQLTINLEGQQAEQVNLYNLDGKLVSQVKQPADNTLDVSGFAKGVYVAEVKVGEASGRRRWVKM